MKIDITRLVKKIIRKRDRKESYKDIEGDFDDYGCGSSSYSSSLNSFCGAGNRRGGC